MSNTMKMVIAASALSMTTLAGAATETVPVKVDFVTPISITVANGLDFGDLNTTMTANDTVELATDGTVTAGLTNVGSNPVVDNTDAAAASVTIAKGAARTVLVTISDATGTGVSVSDYLCEVDSGSLTGTGTSCATIVPEGATSTTIAIGATLTAAAGITEGNDAIDTDAVITVTYN